MSQQIKAVKFELLRNSYITVKSFLENETSENIVSLKTKLAKDMGWYGLDNEELLEKFTQKYDLKYSDFDYTKYFISEGELFALNLFVPNLCIFLIRLPLRMLEILSFKKLSLRKPGYYNTDREVLDLTIKDLITWYIEGEFATSNEIKYKTLTPHNNGS
jgi:hypothetical protein